MNIKAMSAVFGIGSTMAILVGCGGSSSDTAGIHGSPIPQARFVNAMKTPSSVSFKVDGAIVAGPSTFGGITNYQNFSIGNRDVQVVDGSNNILSDNPLNMLEGKAYTAVSFTASGVNSLMVLTDGATVSFSNAAVRFAKVSAANSADDDFYLTAPGVDINTVNPVFSGVKLGVAPAGYAVIPPGTYEIRQTDTGSKTPILDKQITITGGTSNTILDQGDVNFLVLQDR